MRTAHLPTIHASVATKCQLCLGGGPQVNKFEQVSILGHQMSLAGGRQSLYSEAHVGRGAGARGRDRNGVEVLYGEVQVCICSEVLGQGGPYDL